MIISDTIEERGKPVFDFLLNHHLRKIENNIHYFVFQENFSRVKKRLQSNTNLVLHNCITTIGQWNTEKNKESFMQILNGLGSRDVVFVDSLAHVIYQYGLSEAYRIFSMVKTETCKFIIMDGMLYQ